MFIIKLIKSLCFTGEHKDLNVGVCAGEDTHFDAMLALEQKLLPTSMNLVKVLKVSDCTKVVCCDQDNAYVGLVGGNIARIDRFYNIHRSFVATGRDLVTSISIHNNKLYTLLAGRAVKVYTMQGNMINNWTTSDDQFCMTIVGDQIVLSGGQKWILSVHDLNGRLVKQVASVVQGREVSAICALDRYSVIGAAFADSLVFRLNVDTGKLLWSTSEVKNPRGITCYGTEYVLVSGGSSTQSNICILDTDTGQC